MKLVREWLGMPRSQYRLMTVPFPFEDGLLSPSMIQRWLVELMRGFPRGFEMGAREVLEFVKVEHTLFSLPFVLIGFVLADKEFGSEASDGFWIIFAVLGFQSGLQNWFQSFL